ncbi:hypothetical protein [Variovorax sp. UC122_21]|uniref:hypothetical protein n=1 Tax=Variovorax sp. UC122_21 TaxID=3374554 RepID=UPI003758337D
MTSEVHCARSLLKVVEPLEVQPVPPPVKPPLTATSVVGMLEFRSMIGGFFA